MKGDDFIKLLGLTSEDATIKSFLAECGIAKAPKLPRGESDAIVENRKLGLEVTFTDERFLDVKSDKYDDGALVLSNIRMYGDGYVQFKKFTGSLPHGLTFDITAKQAEKVLNRKAAAMRDDKTHGRWDFQNHCVFLQFGEKKGDLGEVAVQLPVE